MRIVIWLLCIIAVPCLFSIYAFLTKGDRPDALASLLLWSPLFLAYMIDRAIAKNQLEKQQMQSEIKLIKTRLNTQEQQHLQGQQPPKSLDAFVIEAPEDKQEVEKPDINKLLSEHLPWK